MKNLMILSISLLCFQNINAQVVTLYSNPELSAQVSANYAYRMAHENIYQDRVDDILNDTERIRNHYTLFVMVKEHVYNSLVNVNSALIQSKQILMMGNNIERIYSNTTEAVSIASEHPELIPFCNNAVSYLTSNSTDIYALLHEFVLNTDKEQLMDYRERQRIVNQLRSRLIMLQGSSYQLVRILKYRSRLSLMDNFLMDFLPQETMLINQIMGNYNRLHF